MTTTVDTAAPTSAAEQFAMRRQSPLQRLQNLLHSHPSISPLLVLLISCIVFTLLNPRFAQPGTIGIILQQTAVIAALAIGQTLVILTAGIDLSVGAIAILSTLFSANLAVKNGVPGVVAILIGVAVGVLAGAVNGMLVTRLRLPPFIVTLGTLSIFTAIALLYSGGQQVGRRDMPAALNWAGTPIIVGPFRITAGVIIVVLLAVVMAFVLSQTSWGRHVYAVGNDVDAARLVGIRVDRVLLSVYTVAGLIYGITAWVQIGRSGTASANAIVDANLDSITAVVIGGTSLFGGRGAIIGTILGALIVGVFRIGLSLAGVDDQWRVLATGLLVIVAVSIDQWIRKVKS
ncbi:ABC transporter permease [Microlunatus capsulatus]|uniref:Fructose transport system permease protein n=1 Tax=Microlunatus capsulatus TaxID=99117 RepID=A0ABS4Z3X3_9ACTN|nr:ABC transporter permease [Microlunatus capsulatus]MBP2415756.1 fructose transport system permease protein [Microlunatus capsulatus]